MKNSGMQEMACYSNTQYLVKKRHLKPTDTKTPGYLVWNNPVKSSKILLINSDAFYYDIIPSFTKYYIITFCWCLPHFYTTQKGFQ